MSDSIGASETGYQGTFAGADDQGRPRFAMGEHTTVLDDDGMPVTPGDGVVGRLARGGYVPIGYYKDPEKTAAVFAEAGGKRWVLPGDMAMVEADGTITLLGRGSVSINTGGEKVFPEEVENALKSHPDVFDVVVVGVPDERWGERVAAVVKARPGATPDGRRPRGARPRAHRGLQGPARGAPRRRGRALPVRQGRLPLGQGQSPPGKS